jgi:hypothetical protein
MIFAEFMLHFAHIVAETVFAREFSRVQEMVDTLVLEQVFINILLLQ